jgi:hypothetical protein
LQFTSERMAELYLDAYNSLISRPQREAFLACAS